MANLKNKYERSVIKLGNSKAITFPQEWTNKAKIKEKSVVIFYPLDDNTIIIRAHPHNIKKAVFKLDGTLWSLNLIKQAIISAFKLNIDEIYLKFNEKNEEKLYELLIDLRREIIGLDFKTIMDTHEFYIRFLLDTTMTTFKEVLEDLVNIFDTIINNIVEGSIKENSNLLLDEIDRKYSLGTRILITGLSDYPFSQIHLPSIRYLGDRVILLYIRDFINEAINLQQTDREIILKFSPILTKISALLKNIVSYYDTIDFKTISEFQEKLNNLQKILNKVNIDKNNCQIKNIIKYYLHSFKTFFDIGITRIIEDEIGML
ncbi:MAG: AbrB/MazE/SpoVT family DNA-binding domain-containing protein [Promethearchaeota archaeon]